MSESAGDSARDGGDAADVAVEGVRANYDWTATAPSIAIVETIASVEDADPAVLSANGELVLSDYVDTEALDALLADERGHVGDLSLDVGEYTVRIDGAELVVTRDWDRTEEE